MYKINFSLVGRDWLNEYFFTDAKTITSVLVQAQSVLKANLVTDKLDIVHIVNNEYLIWAFGECQGFLNIVACETTPQTERIETWQQRSTTYL